MSVFLTVLSLVAPHDPLTEARAIHGRKDDMMRSSEVIREFRMW